MGKASNRRKIRRAKQLAELAASDPESFQRKWNQKMDSWLKEVLRRAKISIKDNENKALPIFDLVDSARLVLDCGVNDNTLNDSCSIDVLINECCKAVSSKADGRLYHLNRVLKKGGGKKYKVFNGKE